MTAATPRAADAGRSRDRLREPRPVEAEPEPEPQSPPSSSAIASTLARSFTAELAARGEELGLIGPLEPPRIWTRHILNCALLAPLLGRGSSGDVGSGAGLPGLVLAIARPDVEFVLIEPMERRVDWLTVGGRSARAGEHDGAAGARGGGAARRARSTR